MEKQTVREKALESKRAAHEMSILDAGIKDKALKKIAEGIRKAYENRRETKIATGRKDIYGYNRNRAISSYVLNENVEIRPDEPKAVFKAVNPALYMIRIDVKDDSGHCMDNRPRGFVLALDSPFQVLLCIRKPIGIIHFNK